jgi:hypothetical protein
MAEMMAIVDRAAEAAGRDPSSILRASSLSISEPWDEVRSAYAWMRDVGIGYLVIEWPGEGRPRVEEFLERVTPSL